MTGGVLPFARPRAVHAWDRFDGMWAAVFYVTLGFPAVSSLLDAGTGTGTRRRVVVVAAVAVVAVARELAVRWVAREVPGGASTRFAVQGGNRHAAVAAAWGLVTLAAMAVLVRADGIFFFALYGLFPQSFVVLPRNWAIAFAGGLTSAVLVAEQGTGAFDDGSFYVSAAGSSLVALALGVFIHGISRESEERHTAIVALEEAQAEAESLLVASLAVSRARTADEVLAGVGACMVDQRIETMALWSGAEPPTLLASWPPRIGGTLDEGRGAPPAPDSASDATTTTLVLAPADDAVLVVETAPGTELTPSARRQLETLAISCGLALANQRLVEGARQAGVAEERARLTREIHDTLAQGFVSVLTQLEAADDGSSSGLPVAVTDRLARARSIARASLGEARRSVQALRPVELESAGLPEAVRRVAGQWSSQSGVQASVTVTGAGVSLPSATEVTLLRAVQETLANAGRHAHASAVNVTLSFLGNTVVLDVHDDGRGFDPAAIVADGDGGFGLIALRQRVAAAGGDVGIESGAGEGTTVSVRLPSSEARS